MPIDVTLAAKAAFDQARKRSETAIPEHMLDMAVVLVPHGVDHLQSETGFDPNVAAVPQATAAVVEYVRTRLLGGAVDSDEAFNAALLRWRIAAGKTSALFTDGSAWDADELGAIAVREAYRGNGTGAHADDLPHAVAYVGMAAAQMQAETGYNPVLVEPALAAEVAVQFARARLQGSRPENDDAYTAAYSRWRRSAAQSTEVAAFDPDAVRDVTALAQIALAQASRGGRRGHATDDLTEAETYVKQALTDMKMSGSYDPDEYATPQADIAAVEYARVSLLGGFGKTSAGYVEALHDWQRQAAIDYHADYSNVYPNPELDNVTRRHRRFRDSPWRTDA